MMYIDNEEVVTTNYQKMFIGKHKTTWKLKGKGEVWVYYKQSEAIETWDIDGEYIIYSVVEENSNITRDVSVYGKAEFRTIALNDANIKSNYYIYNWLEERGILFLNKAEKAFWNTLLSHEEKNVNSYSHVRGILNDSSYAKIEGLIWIKPHAFNSKSYLDQHVMLLSENSWAFTWPALRIENNEVKASHSATISKIPEQMIFYLASRGISKRDALLLLINGFTKKVFDPPEGLWKKIAAKI